MHAINATETAAERKSRALAAARKSGNPRTLEVVQKMDFSDATDRDRAIAAKLQGMAGAALARHGRAVA